METVKQANPAFAASQEPKSKKEKETRLELTQPDMMFLLLDPGQVQCDGV